MAAYTTSTNVGTILSTTFSSATDPTDTEVVNVIARVQAYIDTYTGRTWTTATTSEHFDTVSDARYSYAEEPATNVQRVFFLSNYPVITVSYLRENTSGLSGENWVTRSSGYGGDYLIYYDEGYVEFHQTFPSGGRRNIVIGYTYGVSTVPNDIKYATELLAAAETLDMIKRATDQQGLASVSIGNASYNFGDLENQRKRYTDRAMTILDSRGIAFRSLAV